MNAEPIPTVPPWTNTVFAKSCEDLSDLPNASVHCCVTSPPYWGLRDYDTGAWEGGDPACEHGKRAAKPPSATSTLSGQNSANENHAKEPAQMGAICQLCGATRKDLQIGIEATLEGYVERLVAVFREVRRVLRDDGTLWLNLGDTYAANRSYQVPQTAQDMRDVDRLAMPMSVPLGLKPKDQCLVPHRVAMALQADGWWLRDTIIWSKSNPMPSSVDDRCTPSFEYIFMLAKSHRYFADMDSVRTPLTEATINRLMQPNFEKQTGGVKDYANGTNPNNSMRKAIDNLGKKVRAKTAEGPNARGLRQAPEPGEPGAFNALGANLRNVWVIPTEPFTETRYECESCGSMFITGERIRDREDAPGEPDFKCRGCGAYVRRDSHFAVFPREIPSRCIRIGTSEAGCCAICGAPHRRVIAREVDDQRGSEPDADYADASGAHSRSRAPSTFYAQATSTIRTTAGFEPTCTCAAGTVPCRVLDVFGGSGTTAEVAQSLGRDWVLYEINPGYRDLIAARTQQMGLFAVSSPPAEVQP